MPKREIRDRCIHIKVKQEIKRKLSARSLYKNRGFNRTILKKARL